MAHFRSGKTKEATQYGDEAVGIATKLAARIDPFIKAKACARLGAMLTSAERVEEANQLFKRAIAIAGHNKKASYWGAYACVHLAYNQYNKGAYQESIAIGQQGEQLALVAADNDLQARNIHEQARAFAEIQNWSEAKLLLDRLLILCRQFPVDPYELGMYYKLTAIVERDSGNWPLAMGYFKRALSIQKKAGLTEMYAYTAISVGFSHYQRAEYAEALRYFKEAMRSGHHHETQVQILDNIGAVYWKQKRFELALQSFQKGLTLSRVVTDSSDVLKNPESESIRLVADKEQLLMLIQDKADTWLSYAQATGNNRQRLQHALETYRVADQMIDYMRWEHTGQQSKLYWRQKTRGMYERAIETCYRLGDTDQAFRFFEKSRAVMLADKLNELGARQQLAPQLAEQEEKLRKAVSEQQTMLATTKPTTTNYAKVQSVLIARQDKLDNFHKQLETTNPAYYRYKYDSTVTSVADLQRYLKSQRTSFITYFEGDSALYVMGITPGKVVLQRKPVVAYTQAVKPFMSLLADPDAMNHTATVAQFTTLGNTLYKQLFAPLNVPAGRVIVSPDGSLIPFETLSRSAGKPDFLVKNYAFSYAYSAHLLVRKETGRMQPNRLETGDFLGVAPVSFAPRLEQVRLAGSDKALEPIAGRFGTSTLLTHEAATRRAFQVDVSDYRVIHLFTHATADTTDREPTLYFADSTLRLSDLGDGALPNAQLVVLAACKTGVGAIQRGEGVFSLARGFSALGVPSVLTTLWSVQNDATYRLADSFYGYLDQGFPKDVALQRAKRDWLEAADRASQLPNYWAGLILIGDASPLDRPARWPWLAGGLAALLAAGGLGWRYRTRRVRPQFALPRLF